MTRLNMVSNVRLSLMQAGLLLGLFVLVQLTLCRNPDLGVIVSGAETAINLYVYCYYETVPVR